MKFNNKNKKSAKTKIFGAYATAGLMAFSALSFGILPNTIPYNVLAESSSPFVVTEISNSNFNDTNTSSYPQSASNWEKLNASSGIKAGVISSAEDDFKNHYKDYGLYYSEESFEEESGAHSKAYLMNALNKTAKFGIESAEFSLNANAYYAIRVDVKTGLDCLIDDQKSTIDSFASIYLKLGDDIVASKPYIISNNTWSEYYFFVQTSFEEETKAKLQLYLGSKEADSAGAVMFDNISCVKYSKNAYDAKFSEIANSHKATTMDGSHAYQYISETSLSNTDYANRIEVTNTLFTDAEMGDSSAWEKDTYGNLSAIKSGFIDLSLGYQPATTMIAKSPETNQLTAESKMMFMNVVKNGENEGGAVTFTSDSFTLKRFGSYLIQFYVKTGDLAGAGLHASVVPTSKDYSAVKLASISSSASSITNNWSLCQIYVQSSSYEPVEAKLEFGIGSVTDKTKATGWAFIDDLRAFEISNSQYSKASTGSNVGKGNFSKSVSNNSKISNANFDQVADTAGINAPFAPVNWEAKNADNKESGIINNQYIGFNAGGEYGGISWDTVGLTSAQSFIDSNSREVFVDANGNFKFDEGETYTDSNGNGEFDGEIYVANQNLLMLNTISHGYQAYSCSPVDLNASTLYRLSVDSKAIVEGAYIKVTFGENVLTEMKIEPSVVFKNQELLFLTPMSKGNFSIEVGLGTKDKSAVGYAFFDAVMLTEITDSSSSDFNPQEKLKELTEADSNLNSIDLSSDYFNIIPNTASSVGLYSAQSWKSETETVGVNAGIRVEGENNTLMIATENANTNHKVVSNFKYTLDSAKYYKVSFTLNTSAFEGLENSGAIFGFTEKDGENTIFSGIISEEEKTYEFYLKAGELSEITPFISLATSEATSQEYAELIDFKIETITETDFKTKENAILNNTDGEDYSNVIMLGKTVETEDESDGGEDSQKDFEPSAWGWILPTLITCLSVILATIAMIFKKVKRRVGRRGKKYKNAYDRKTTIHKAILDKEIAELREQKIEEAKKKLLATQEKLRLLETNYKEKTKNEKVNKEAEYKKLVRSRKKHASDEQKLKDEIAYLESDEYTEIAKNEVLANKEKEIEKFTQENQLEQFEDTQIEVDENGNEIEDNNEEITDLSEVREIIIDENAEKVEAEERLDNMQQETETEKTTETEAEENLENSTATEEKSEEKETTKSAEDKAKKTTKKKK